MSPENRLALVIQLSTPGLDHPGYIDVNVQVYRAGEHVGTVSVIDQIGLPLEYKDEVRVEHFATSATRMIARLTDEHVFAKLEAGQKLHGISDFPLTDPGKSPHA